MSKGLTTESPSHSVIAFATQCGWVGCQTAQCLYTTSENLTLCSVPISGPPDLAKSRTFTLTPTRGAGHPQLDRSTACAFEAHADSRSLLCPGHHGALGPTVELAPISGRNGIAGRLTDRGGPCSHGQSCRPQRRRAARARLSPQAYRSSSGLWPLKQERGPRQSARAT